MTLIVSEVSRHGIVMAADSAITESYPDGWKMSLGTPVPLVVRIGAQKIIPIHAINAAMAVWGFASVGMPDNLEARIPVDRFLQNFASTIDGNMSLEDVGNRLAQRINERIKVGKVRGGVHLAGFVQCDGLKFPALYHIHTGHNLDGPYEKLRVYRDFPFDRGLSPAAWLKELETKICYLRNGSFNTYAIFQTSLNGLMNNLRNQANFICPDESRFNSPLEARGKFLKLQLQTMCEFYRLSNKLETIAMPISWISISEKGIEHFEQIVI